jgi:hypothetical protein
MLGVSPAATIGFNFQWTYCGYSYLMMAPGAVVTAPAFGLQASQWTSLEAMCIEPGPYVLNEMVGVASGSVNVNWSAVSAGANGSFFGPSPGPGQVYYTFLSDGIVSSNQPGYWVDVGGLKSLFTNSPFVVQLIASFGGSTNSIQSLTNAFIIDAGASATQSVSYPNIGPGNRGGLSTASSPLDTDRLSIIGAPAQQGAGPPSFYHASTLSGFILTDQPVVTMSPQSVSATAGDTVLLRALVIGVPPLSFQWRRDGVPLAGATNLSYGVTNIQAGADFDLVTTNLYGGTTSQVARVSVSGLSIEPGPALVLDTKPAGAPAYGGNFGATWMASSQDSNGLNRVGVMQFSGSAAAHIVLPTAGTTNFDFDQGTIMFWMRTPGFVTNASGVLAGIFDRSLSIVQASDGTVQANTGTYVTPLRSTSNVSDGRWHHIALETDDVANAPVILFIDGLQEAQEPVFPGEGHWPAGQPIELGQSQGGQLQYNGLLDDFRIYNRKLTQAEIASIVSTDALVDTNALQVRWGFDAPPVPGLSIVWPGGTAVLQSAPAPGGPYTALQFPTSPLYAQVTAGQQFYRFWRTPTLIISNPFDM